MGLGVDHYGGGQSRSIFRYRFGCEAVNGGVLSLGHRRAEQALQPGGTKYREA